VKHALVMMAVATTAGAQVPLRGVAYDSLHGRPLAGAFVGIVGMSVTAMSDSLGRFVLPSVPKGTHRVVMQHDVLDAIGLSAAGARAVVNDERDTVVVAVPSFATLWRAACGIQPPGADTGFVFGSVLQGNRPVARATVAASWIDLYVDSTKVVRQKQKIMEADADSAGNFALCGVPTTTGLSLRAVSGDRAGVWIDLAPLDKERIARRDLTIVALAPMQFDLPKTSVFSGRVRRDSLELPLPDADVMLPELGLSSLTNARGEFHITGVTPGTHLVQVRKIGFTFREQRLEFGTESVDRTLIMSRIATLDSVKVTSRYSPNDEAMRLFEENRKLGLGKFFTREDLEKHRDRRLIDLLGQLPGVKAQSGTGGQGWLLSNRGSRSLSPSGGRCSPPMLQDHPEAGPRMDPRGGPPPPPPCTNACYPRVFLDGAEVTMTEVPNINRFTPFQLEAIEFYAGAAQTPPEYNRLNKAVCGTVVLHTRRGK
jgi:hypothetical protein